jgi:hypothetical protein
MDKKIIFTVYHVVKPTFREDFDPKSEFKPVAIIIRNVDESVPQATLLDEVFGMTNHVDSDWTKNDNITWVAEGSQRSTSVGDRITAGFATYKVMEFGFERVK